MSNDKLAEALGFLDRVHRGLISGRISEWPGLREACGIVYAAHAAEAVQAKAQSGEWVMVPHEPDREMMDDAANMASLAGVIISRNHICAIYQTMLAAAPRQATEPVAWMTPAKNYFGSFEGCTDACNGAPIPLYAHPQPAQNAALYQELLMAVEKKFPGESRHETALRYIRETELQSREPKCDAAMAKEPGR